MKKLRSSNDRRPRGLKPAQSRALLLGLDSSGKTTLLYQLKLGEVVTTIPTIGFNVEMLNGGRVDLTIWDVGASSKLIPLWRHYLQGTDILFWVVDSSARQRFEESRRTLVDLINVQDGSHELKDARLVIVANKQDLPGAASLTEVATALRIDPETTQLSETTKNVEVMLATATRDITQLADYCSKVQQTRRRVGAAAAADDDDDDDADPRAPVEILRDDATVMFWRMYSIVSQDPVAPSMPACMLGGNATSRVALPSELVAKVCEYLPLDELLPSGYLMRHSAAMRDAFPQSAWLVSRTFMIAAFTEAATRFCMFCRDVVLPGAPERPLEAEVIGALRPLLYLNVPQDLRPLHTVTFTTLLRYAMDLVETKHSLAPMLRTTSSLVDAFGSTPGDRLGRDHHLSRALYYAELLQHFVDASDIEGAEEAPDAPLDDASTASDGESVDESDAEGHGIDVKMDFEALFKSGAMSLLPAQPRKGEPSAEWLRGVARVGRWCHAALCDVVARPRALRASSRVPRIHWLRVAGHPLLCRLPTDRLAEAILSRRYRCLELTEELTQEPPLCGGLLPPEVVAAALAVVEEACGDAPEARCRFVQMTLRLELVPAAILAAIRGAEQGSRVREVMVTCPEVKNMQSLLSGDVEAPPAVRRAVDALAMSTLEHAACARDAVRITMRRRQPSRDDA